ncbi:hypothetical protein Tsubulata_030367 [Turnera subulata]|uniref:Helicase ATP-binding domain-containing protein n=1 Tax=Turnera subulata TaxID=218843 RepID=A0A9Q0GMH2_9ROSI|nr:hypothetical protein Tsubulata_030367 [Turnera subulata]
MKKPTPIQCQALTIVLSGIGMAKTGSGKTAAFVLPMIVHIMDQPELAKEEGPIGVVCTPTGALAHQIYLETKEFAKSHGICVSAVYGVMSKLDQFKELKAGCEIVIATPGRLIDMLKMKALNMSRATYLVLDEADRMFDRQTLLFSATMPRKIEKLAREILSDPVKSYCREEKLPWLLEKLPGVIDEGDVLVFASKKATVDEIEAQLAQDEFKVAALHGDKNQASRRTGLAGDKDGIAYALITQKEARFAGELVNSLIAAGQNVSTELMDLAMKGKGRGGADRGACGVDFCLGICYNPESSSSTSSHAAPSQSAAVNSLRTGVMSQFKSNFVAASSNSQSQGFNSSSAYANKRPALTGFVSGGSIGGDISRSQTTSSLPGFVSCGSIACLKHKEICFAMSLLNKKFGRSTTYCFCGAF